VERVEARGVDEALGAGVAQHPLEVGAAVDGGDGGHGVAGLRWRIRRRLRRGGHARLGGVGDGAGGFGGAAQAVLDLDDHQLEGVGELVAEHPGGLHPVAVGHFGARDAHPHHLDGVADLEALVELVDALGIPGDRRLGAKAFSRSSSASKTPW
jgi:hypothetical protein